MQDESSEQKQKEILLSITASKDEKREVIFDDWVTEADFEKVLAVADQLGEGNHAAPALPDDVIGSVPIRRSRFGPEIEIPVTIGERLSVYFTREGERTGLRLSLGRGETHIHFSRGGGSLALDAI